MHASLHFMMAIEQVGVDSLWEHSYPPTHTPPQPICSTIMGVGRGTSQDLTMNWLKVGFSGDTMADNGHMSHFRGLASL